MKDRWLLLPRPRLPQLAAIIFLPRARRDADRREIADVLLLAAYNAARQQGAAFIFMLISDMTLY